MTKYCSVCDIKFENPKSYSNHIRWAHKLNIIKCKFCNKEIRCNISRHENSCSLNPNNIKFCLYCEEVISDKRKKFCNASCSAKFNNNTRQIDSRASNCLECNAAIQSITCTKKFCTECARKRSRNSTKYGSPYGQKKEIFQICTICNQSFIHYTNKKTCSEQCRNILRSHLSRQNKNCGGETNYKRYTYKGISFDSSWEMEIAIFLDVHKIKWARSREIVLYWMDSAGNQRRYYPDFYLEDYNLYIDPKNLYKQQLDREKINYIRKSETLIVGNVEECKQQILEYTQNV